MPETTPGQVAYAAYCTALQWTRPLTWETLPPIMQAAWEAATQAVLALTEAAAPCFLFALGDVLRLATATRPHPVRSRRWVEREVMPPYAEYGFVAADGTVFWEVEADLVPWEEDIR